MNDEEFNIELRKFLKTFGVSAQREIERVAREAAPDARDDGRLHVRARLEFDGSEGGLMIEGALPLT